MSWIAIVTLLACSSTSNPRVEERAASPAEESPRASPEELEPPAAPSADEPVTPTQTGDLTVDVNHGWGEVWLDGERITDETPLNAWTTSVGRHQLRVVQSETQDVLLDIDVEVHPDEMTIVHLDATDRTHHIERFDDAAPETAPAAIVSALDGTTCLAPGPAAAFVIDGEVNVRLRGPRARQQGVAVATDTMTVSMGAARRRPPTAALRLTDALYRSGDIFVVSQAGHLEIRNDDGVLGRTPLTMPRWAHPLTTVDEPCIAMGISDDVVLTTPDSPWAVVALQHSIPDVCEVRNPPPRCSVIVIRLAAP